MNITSNSPADFETAGKNKRIFLLCFVIFSFFIVGGPVWADVVFTPPAWEIGRLERGVVTELEVEISNSGEKAVEIEFISTCDCFYPDRYFLNIPPGETEVVTFYYDTSDDTGSFEKYIIVRTDDPELSKALFAAVGSVPPGEVTDHEPADEGSSEPETDELEIEYYYSPTCRSCIEFLEEEVPEVEKKLKIDLRMKTVDVLEGENFEEFQDRIDQLGVTSSAFPVLIIGDIVLQGDREIEGEFPKALEAYIAGEDYAPPPEEVVRGGEEKLLVLPVVLAGLLDGINPCAFTTLIFLLAALALAGKTRHEVLIIGIFFTITVFITYSLIGLGFFKTLRLAVSFPLIGKIIRIVLVGVLLVFAAISFYDYVIIKRGNPNKIILQLPKAMKKQIHSSVRSYTRSGALIGSSILMGFFVSVFELGCTGQVYFPTIAYLVQVERQALGYLLLVVYNLGFILPLVIVFVLTYKGVSSDKITGLFRKHMGKVKICTGILFIGLAVLTLLT